MKNSRRSQRGSALLLVVIIVLILVGISFAYQSISWWNQRRAFQEEAGTQALYIAESAASDYVNQLNSPSGPTSPAVKTKTYLNGGYYWAPAENIATVGTTTDIGTNLNTGYYNFQMAAKFGGVTRRLDVIISKSTVGAFNKVYDAENQKGGAFNSTFASGDKLQGDAYVNGDLSATGTAQLLDTTGTTGNVTKYTGTNTSTVTGPNYVKGKEDPLNLDPDPNGLSRWENKAAANRSTTNHLDGNGTKYIDVSNELTTKGVVGNKWNGSDGFGGAGTDILDVNNPAHIFRKDPGSTNGTPDRTTQYEWLSAKSPKSSYYLEDPTNASLQNQSLNGTAHPVNGDTNASMINIKDNGNNAVYFIDGNMRVSGEPIKSYQLAPDPSSVTGPLAMTVIVKGNVSLTDNVLLPSWQSKTDGLAIVAIEDPAFPNVDASAFAAGKGSTALTPSGVSIDTFVAAYNTKAAQAKAAGLNFDPLDLTKTADWDRAAQEYNKIYGSGNVFFGDPGSGTVEHFESYLYAQNNFYATNLDSGKGSGGTQKIEIYGNMAAGNKVMINRNVDATFGGYVPLNLMFDPLIAAGGNLPDLPRPKSSSGQPWTIQSWKQSALTGETGGDVK